MSTVQASPGVIEAGAVYRIEEFKRRVGWGSHAMRQARRAGMKVVYTAGRAYIRGADFISYLDRLAGAESQ